MTGVVSIAVGSISAPSHLDRDHATRDEQAEQDERHGVEQKPLEREGPVEPGDHRILAKARQVRAQRSAVVERPLDGTAATLFVNGVSAATRNYTGPSTDSGTSGSIEANHLRTSGARPRWPGCFVEAQVSPG